MPQEHNTVFISYRRSVASFIARAVFQDLRDNGYDVFMDVESIDNGQFDTIILNQIEARAHFVLVLTPGTVERCVEQNDWLRREIEFAMDKQRNIVPLLVSGFSFAGTDKYLTGKLSGLSRFNGLSVPHDYFDAAMYKLRTRFLKQTVRGIVKPTPVTDQDAVERNIVRATEQAAQSPPLISHATEYETDLISAEDFAGRGYDKLQNGFFDSAIADYSAALRLNPRYVDAYFNRAIAREALGDLAGAIDDYQAYLELGGGRRYGDQLKIEQTLLDLRRRLYR